MSTETTTVKKPRAPRKSKVVEVPKCVTCSALLTWRDFAYCGKETKMCKVCHGKTERMRLRGMPVPRERLPRAAMSYGADKTVKLTARPGLPRPSKPASVPTAPKQRVTRASRRAQARKTEQVRKESAA